MITKEQAKELRRLSEKRRKAEAYVYECETSWIEDALEYLYEASDELEAYIDTLTEN